MSVIQTNYLSLVAQNNLQKSQSQLGSAIERLSSGMRINSAKDDAAGQAIANRFTANIRGLQQANRNANDGISIAQTTEGALNEINNNLQRVRELTNQAVNGSNSGTDLDSIQAEIKQRLDEIDRVSEQTQFNGVHVLAKDNSLSIQVGANDGQTIKIDLQAINSNTLGLTGFNVNGKGSVANEAATADSLKLAGNVSIDNTDPANPVYNVQVANKALTAADALGQLKDGDTVTFAGETPFGTGTVAAGAYTADGKGNFSYDVDGLSAADVGKALAPAAGSASTSAKIEIGGKSVDVQISGSGNITTANGAALYIDEQGNLTETISDADVTKYAAATVANLTAAMTGEDMTAIDGTTALTATGANIATASIELANGTTFTGTGDVATGIDVTGAQVSAQQLLAMEADDAAGMTLNGLEVGGAPVVVTINTAAGVTSVEAGGDAVYADADGALTTDEQTNTQVFVRSNGVITDNQANQYFVNAAGDLTTEAATVSDRTTDPLKALDAAMSTVDSLRSDLGAIQNRFESTITNLNNTVTNLSAARSRIQDADYAVEVSNMTRAQILQQAGTSVLAQANQVPQGVLSLLR